MVTSTLETFETSISSPLHNNGSMSPKLFEDIEQDSHIKKTYRDNRILAPYPLQRSKLLDINLIIE